MSKAEKEIKAVLDTLGVPYRIEHGKAHKKIYFGERMAGVFSVGPKPDKCRRNILNLISQLKRAAKDFQYAT